jgi:hypothetical protein
MKIKGQQTAKNSFFFVWKLQKALCSSTSRAGGKCFYKIVKVTSLREVELCGPKHEEVWNKHLVWPANNLHFWWQCRYKTSPEMHLIYWGNKEIHCIFKTRNIISVSFPTKCCSFHNFISFLNNMVFINCVLNLKVNWKQETTLVIPHNIAPVQYHGHKPLAYFQVY